jgi:hypothetical protein
VRRLLGGQRAEGIQRLVSCSGCVVIAFFLPFSLPFFRFCDPICALMILFYWLYMRHPTLRPFIVRCGGWIPLIHLIDYDELTAQIVPERCLFLSSSFLLRLCVFVRLLTVFARCSFSSLCFLCCAACSLAQCALLGFPRPVFPR